MKCEGCLFNDGITEEACMAQNLACLPTKEDMVKWHNNHRIALSCHDNQSIPCHGLSEVVDTSNDRILKYGDWYNGNFGTIEQRRPKIPQVI